MLEEESGRRGYETELVTNSADLVISTSMALFPDELADLVFDIGFHQIRG
jgi:hypothetical protein